MLPVTRTMKMFALLASTIASSFAAVVAPVGGTEFSPVAFDPQPLTGIPNSALFVIIVGVAGLYAFLRGQGNPRMHLFDVLSSRASKSADKDSDG